MVKQSLLIENGKCYFLKLVSYWCKIKLAVADEKIRDVSFRVWLFTYRQHCAAVCYNRCCLKSNNLFKIQKGHSWAFFCLIVFECLTQSGLAVKSCCLDILSNMQAVSIILLNIPCSISISVISFNVVCELISFDGVLCKCKLQTQIHDPSTHCKVQTSHIQYRKRVTLETWTAGLIVTCCWNCNLPVRISDQVAFAKPILTMFAIHRSSNS